jgi:hypothetical protein
MGPKFCAGGLPPGICKRRGVGSHRVGIFALVKSIVLALDKSDPEGGSFEIFSVFISLL